MEDQKQLRQKAFIEARKLRPQAYPFELLELIEILIKGYLK